MQPLAIGTSATDDPDAPPTAPPVAEGPLGPRARRAAMAALVVLAACLVVGSGLPDRLRGVVDARPEYAWSLDAIELDPPPPEWLRDGRAVLLDGARPALERFEGRSALDDDLLPAIERAFKNLRWVERVERVRQAYPNKVTVALRYRRPVAVHPFGDFDGDDYVEYFIDGHGVILAANTVNDSDGLDIYALPWRCVILGLEPPYRPEVGASWALPPSGDDEDGTDAPNRVAEAAAGLAAFLIGAVDRDGWPTAPSGEVLRFDVIQPLSRAEILKGGGPGPDEDIDDFVRKGQARELYLRCKLPTARAVAAGSEEETADRLLYILWRSAPGRERPDEPTAAEKWTMLRNWVAKGGADQPLGRGCLDFTTHGEIWRPASKLK